MSDRLLDIADLSAGYGGSTVLQGVSLHVDRSEIVAVLGRNGMGKTTLLKSIIGIVPSDGSVSLLENNLAGLPSHRRANLGIGYVPQGRGLFSGMSVADNIRAGMTINSEGRAPRESFRSMIGELFPIIEARKTQVAGTMSGGEQQQVAIARALIGKPSLLMLDEPSEGIQPSIVHQIVAAIRRLNRDGGQAVLLVEQNIEIVSALAHRCYVLENGRIIHQAKVESGRSEQLYEMLRL